MMTSERRYALIAAWAYLAMTVIALFATFDPAVVAQTGVNGGAGIPWPDAVTRGLALRLAGLAVIALLDVVIAWALWRLFTDRQPALAAWMAATRVLYAIGFAYSQSHIAAALGIARSTIVSPQSATSVLDALARFERDWDVAFFAFAAHLVLLGVIMFAPGVARRVLSLLLVVAGLGYLADSAIALAMPAVTFLFAPYTFVGEMTLMLWLFFRAGKPGRS